MGKPRPTDMYGEIENDVKVDILTALWRSSWRIKSAPTEETRWDAWVYRQMQFSTNTFMIGLFLFAIALPFFLMRPTGLPRPLTLRFIASFAALTVFLSISFPYILPRIFIRLLCHKVGIRSDKSFVRGKFVDYYEKSLNWYDRCFFVTWKYFAFLHPIGFPFIWWWTLILGIISAEVKYTQQHANHVDAEMCVNELALSIMTALVVSLIAYIATNIIRELLAIRRGYTKAASKVDAVDDLLTRVNNELPDLIENAQDTLDKSLVILSTGSALLELQKETAKNERTRKEFDKFLDNTTKQTKSLVDRLKESTDIEVRLCLLGLLNQYLDTEVQVLTGTEKHIVTRFTTLARIAEALVAAIFPKDKKKEELDPKDLKEIEFYALLVKPPKSFLNYDTTGLVGATDENWESYLDSNITASGKGIKQFRYFLSIKAEKRKLYGFPELVDLHFEDVKRDLRSFVKLKEDLPDKTKVGSRQMYVIEERKRRSRNWKTLAEVLSTIYHREKCCFVREFGFDEFREHFMKNKRKDQSDSELLKPKDYYAVRKGNAWKFCLETTYDKALDAADIRVLHDGLQKDSSNSDSWEECKNRLDKIFLNDTIGLTFPIQDYT